MSDIEDGERGLISPIRSLIFKDRLIVAFNFKFLRGVVFHLEVEVRENRVQVTLWLLKRLVGGGLVKSCIDSDAVNQEGNR